MVKLQNWRGWGVGALSVKRKWERVRVMDKKKDIEHG